MDTVPFKLSNVCAGFAEGHGLLRNESTHLCLEYQVKDGLIGAIKSDLRHLRIPFGDVASVSLTEGWFGTRWGVKLVIQATHMDMLHDVPGSSQGRIDLSIAPRDYEAAEEFVYRLHSNGAAPTASAKA